VLYNYLTAAIWVFLAVFILASAIKIIPEYERAVLFRLGRLINARGPGLIFIIPIIDRIVRMSLRIVVVDVPPQDVITKDNVACKVNAVLYYRIIMPENAVVNVENFHEATNQLAQTTLRSVVGTAELDELLSQREKLNQTIQKIVDESTDPWGIKVTGVEIKDVLLPTEMTRAIARQAEAERNRRSYIIQAEGERQASEELARASEILSGVEGGMTLRTLRSLSEVANTPNTTVLFPLPMELRQLLPAIENYKNTQGKASADETA